MPPAAYFVPELAQAKRTLVRSPHPPPLVEEADNTVDAVGLKCPEPLMIVRNKVREMASGETVGVVATDPSTVRDFTNFCRFMGHELAASTRDGDRYLFVIRKR